MLMICPPYRESDRRDAAGRHGTRPNADFDLKAVRTGIGAAIRTIHSDAEAEQLANGFAGRPCGGQQQLQNQGIIGIILDEPLTCVQFVTGLLRGPPCKSIPP